MTGSTEGGAALVTGAARRIGRTIALELAREGCDVAVHYGTSREEADAVVDEIRALGVQAVAVQGDLADPEAPLRLVLEAERGLGRPLTVLVNNASRFEPDALQTMTLADWTAHMDINLRAPVFLAQAFAAQKPRGIEGNIINIIDQRVLKLNPLFFSYTLSKTGLWTATRTMAQALAEENIRVNAVSPGPCLANARMSEADFARQCELTLLGRGTTPEEIAAAVRFILSAPAMTGQMIVLDGGQHLNWQTPDITEVRE